LIINANANLLTYEDKAFMAEENVSTYTFDATELAISIAKTELATNMAMIGALVGITKIVSKESVEGAINERFGKKFVASGGTATLDEAIKKKFAKKEQLLKKNMETIFSSYETAEKWAKEQNLAIAV
jgi:pyruvate ferredoxin oxidoreductase gamma subunit